MNTLFIVCLKRVRKLTKEKEAAPRVGLTL